MCLFLWRVPLSASVSACIGRTESTFVCAEMFERGCVTPLNPGAQRVSYRANPHRAVLQVLTSADEQMDAAGRRHVSADHVVAEHSLAVPPRPTRWNCPVAALPKAGGAGAAPGERACARGADCGSPGSKAAPALGPAGEPAARRARSGRERRAPATVRALAQSLCAQVGWKKPVR